MLWDRLGVLKMPVPQPITDALSALQADADAVANATLQAAKSSEALTTAQAQAQSDSAAVTAAQAHEATDLAALQTLLQQTYGSSHTPPIPTPTPNPLRKTYS